MVPADSVVVPWGTTEHLAFGKLIKGARDTTWKMSAGCSHDKEMQELALATLGEAATRSTCTEDCEVCGYTPPRAIGELRQAEKEMKKKRRAAEKEEQEMNKKPRAEEKKGR